MLLWLTLTHLWCDKRSHNSFSVCSQVCLMSHSACLCVLQLSSMLLVWPDGQDVWRSDSLADTRLVPLPSLVKPGWLPGWSCSAYPLPPQQTKSWLKQPGLPVAIVIGNTGSPLLKTCFWLPCSRGFFTASPSKLRHPHCLQCSSSCFCRQCSFVFFNHAWCTSLVAHEFVIIVGGGDQEKLWWCVQCPCKSRTYKQFCNF